MYRMSPGNELILASASPRRREMLGRVGLEFAIEPAEVDESLLPGEEAGQAAQRLAGLKASAVAARRPGCWVLAADTLVARGSHILGKPRDEAEARSMLETLSGATHLVVTGFCLAGKETRRSGLAQTKVSFRELTPSEIKAYVASGEPFGKAGAYAIQGRGAALVKEVAGSYTNVVGLPLAKVLDELLELKVIVPAQG